MNKQQKRKVKICGVSYEIRQATEKHDKNLKDAYGFCDLAEKTIVLNAENSEGQRRHTLRHEITHAFFAECGLYDYATDETLVDFLATQLDKLLAICKQLDILEE